MELEKLASFSPSHAPSRNRQWHVFTVEDRSGREAFKRVFLRGLLHQIGTTSEYLAASYDRDPNRRMAAVMKEVEDTVVGCLEELIRVQHVIDHGLDWSHVFLSVLPPLPLDEESIEGLRMACSGWLLTRSAAMRAAHVAGIEIKMRGFKSRPWHVMLSLPTGYEIGQQHVDVFKERQVEKQRTRCTPLSLPLCLPLDPSKCVMHSVCFDQFFGCLESPMFLHIND